MKTLQIVDGDNVAHVAFHSLLGRGTKDCDPDFLARIVKMALEEVPTKFAEMIYAAANEHNPTHGLIVFDSGGETFRKKLYPAYKSNRPAKLFDMAELRTTLKTHMQNHGWKSCMIDGYEGDDVMASIATRLKAKEIRSIIFSSDQDMWQLISDPLISCVNPINFRVATEETVKAKYGLTVAQYGDLKVLQGDVGDNVPGVSLWGIKRSTDALLKYDNLENVIKNSEEIGGKLGEALRDAPWDLCKQLTGLLLDVPLPFTNLSELEIPMFDA